MTRLMLALIGLTVAFSALLVLGASQAHAMHDPNQRFVELAVGDDAGQVFWCFSIGGIHWTCDPLIQYGTTRAV